MSPKEENPSDQFSTGGQSPASPFTSGGSSATDAEKTLKSHTVDIALLKTLMQAYEQSANTLKSQIDDINQNLSTLKREIKKTEKKIETAEAGMRTSELRSIEVIGIISSIIALVLVYVGVAREPRPLIDSVVILLMGTSSLIIFASLLHVFFNRDYPKQWAFGVILFLAIVMFGYSIYSVSQCSKKGNLANNSGKSVQSAAISEA